MPALNFWKFQKGINLAPQSGSPSSPTNGDLYYDSSASRFKGYINGATDTLAGLATADTLTNKTISGSANTLSNIADASLAVSYFKADGSRSLSGALIQTQQATPSNPSAGSNKLYFKSDNILYTLTSGGVEAALTAGAVSGPGSSTNTAVPKWNGTSGSALSNTGVLIDASNNITANNLSGTNTGDVTIGTGNGLSLAGQAISLALAGAAQIGAVSTSSQTFAGGKTFTSAMTVNSNGQNTLLVQRYTNAGDGTGQTGVRVGNSGSAQGDAQFFYTNAAAVASPNSTWTFTPRNNADTSNTDAVRITLSKTSGSDGGDFTLQTSTTGGTLTNALVASNAQKITIGASGGTQTHVVNGNISTSLVNFLADGSASAPSLGLTNSTTTGLFRAGSNILGFSANGVEVGRYSAAGSWKFTSSTSTVFQMTCSNNDANFIIEGTDGGAGSGGNLQFLYTKTGAGAGSRTVAKILGVNTNVTPASSGGQISLQTSNTAGSLTAALRLDEVQDVTALAGNVIINTAGKGLSVKEGSNAKMGVATLSAGTVTVSTTAVTASSRIFLTVQSLGTVAVATPIAVTARSAGTSFTISSSSVTDTSVIAWMLVEPA